MKQRRALAATRLRSWVRHLRLATPRLALTKPRGNLIAGICSGILLVLIVGTLIHGRGTSAAAATGQQTLQGTDLGSTPAPAFHLLDQSGAVVSLDQFRGHPIVLTFFDSVCPHQDCSLMAQYINQSAKGLDAKDASQVVWLALSLNPWHDTPATAKAFLSGHQVTIPLHYLLGTLTQLQPLWKAYYMQSILQPDGVVIHTTGVFVIDAQGRERNFLFEGFDPRMLSGDLHLLLTQRSAQHATGTTAPTGGSFVQTQTVDGEALTLTAVPGAYGTYSFTVAAQDAQAQPLQGATVALDLSMTDMYMGDLVVPLRPVGFSAPGTYQATGVLSMYGQWQAIVEVTPQGSRQQVKATFTFTAKF
jgi:protein SCO1/2